VLRCAEFGVTLATFKSDVANIFNAANLCPLSNVKDRCVWIGLFKPWFSWSRTGMTACVCVDWTVQAVVQLVSYR